MWLVKRAGSLIDDVDYQELSPDDRAQLFRKFDAEYYLGENPELGVLNTDLLMHYLTVGWREEWFRRRTEFLLRAEIHQE